MSEQRTATAADPAEVYALRYATMHNRRASEVYYRYGVHGLEDRMLDMDNYFWLIRSASGVTLVDCGWNRGGSLPNGGPYSRVTVEQTDPVELLARVGVEPGDVDTVIVSHMHFDHVGNLDLFPEANLVLARAEYDCWTGPYGALMGQAHSVKPAEVEMIQDFGRRGRLRLIEGTEEVLPGITATPVGGHTPGQLLVDIETSSGTVVLASDAVHYHEELNEDRLFYIFSDMADTFDTYQRLRERAQAPGTWVVSGHDPLEMHRFAAVNQDCVDLTKPIG